MADTGYISPFNTPQALQGQVNPVALPSQRAQELNAKRELPRTLMGGSDAVRAAKQRFTPQHPKESDLSYSNRLQNTTLFGGFSRGVKQQAGKLFMKPVVLTDAGADVEDFTKNVDGQGSTLTAFIANVVEEAFVDGVSYVLADFPSIPAGSTQADQTEMGVRPYWVMIRAGQVLGWKSVNIAGNQTLLQFRYMEEVEEDLPDPFSTVCIKQIRVLFRGGMYQVYRWMPDHNGKMDWRLYEEGGATWLEIPVVPFYTNKCGFYEGTPPLTQLAELNLEHWVSSSEQRRAISFLRFAMLAFTGVPATQEWEIGPDSTFNLPAGATVAYVEPSGNGIKSGADDLVAIERRMQSVGMELRIENAGQVTATAAIIDSSESNAALKAVAQGSSSSTNQLLLITAAFMASPSPGTAKVYDEFASERQGTVMDYVSLFNSGLASRETIWDELIARHYLDEDFDPELEKQRLDEEAAAAQEAQLAMLQGAPLQLPADNSQPANNLT